MSILRWCYSQGINRILCTGNGTTERRYNLGVAPWLNAAKTLNKKTTVYNFVPPVLDKELASAYLRRKEPNAPDDVVKYAVDKFPRILPWLYSAFKLTDDRGRVSKDTVFDRWNLMHIPYFEGTLTDEQMKSTDDRLRLDILAWKIRHRDELKRVRAFRRRVYGEK